MAQPEASVEPVKAAKETAEVKERKPLRKRISNFFVRLTACFMPWRKRKRKNQVAPAPQTSEDEIADVAVEVALKASMSGELAELMSTVSDDVAVEKALKASMSGGLNDLE